MAGGEFLNQAGDSSKLISGEGVRDDEDPAVGALVVAHLTKGFRTIDPGKRLKSLSMVHNSPTPCCWHKAAIRASCTCGPDTRPV
jgi:hypothetical protein